MMGNFTQESQTKKHPKSQKVFNSYSVFWLDRMKSAASPTLFGLRMRMFSNLVLGCAKNPTNFPFSEAFRCTSPVISQS